MAECTGLLALVTLRPRASQCLPRRPRSRWPQSPKLPGSILAVPDFHLCREGLTSSPTLDLSRPCVLCPGSRLSVPALASSRRHVSRPRTAPDSGSIVRARLHCPYHGCTRPWATSSQHFFGSDLRIRPRLQFSSSTDPVAGLASGSVLGSNSHPWQTRSPALPPDGSSSLPRRTRSPVFGLWTAQLPSLEQPILWIHIIGSDSRSSLLSVFPDNLGSIQPARPVLAGPMWPCVAKLELSIQPYVAEQEQRSSRNGERERERPMRAQPLRRRCDGWWCAQATVAIERATNGSGRATPEARKNKAGGSGEQLWGVGPDGNPRGGVNWVLKKFILKTNYTRLMCTSEVMQ